MASFEIEKVGEFENRSCEVWDEEFADSYDRVYWTLYVRKADGMVEALFDRDSEQEVQDLLREILDAAGDSDSVRLAELLEENDQRLSKG